MNTISWYNQTPFFSLLFSLSRSHFHWIYRHFIAILLLPFYFRCWFFFAPVLFLIIICVCVCVRHGNEFHLFFIVNAGILKCIIKNNVICSKLKYSMVAFLYSLWSFDGGMSDSSFFSLKAMKNGKYAFFRAHHPGLNVSTTQRMPFFRHFYWFIERRIVFLLPEMVFNRSRSAVCSEVIKKQCQRVQK